jgi:redox-sensitive bicupin YhaK (pirin superfamily)
VKHSDSTGHSGTIEAGDVQWMCAGRGIMHEEMPERANGKLDGLQLWVNLSSADKMKRPEYQEYKAKDIPSFKYEGHDIRLVSGRLLGRKGAVEKINTQPIFADINLQSNKLVLALPERYSAFIYVLQGSVDVLDDKNKATSLQAFELGVLTDGKQLVLKSNNNARIVLVAGRPIREPIARSGPFVMNTQAEIMQVFRELQAGTFPPD